VSVLLRIETLFIGQGGGGDERGERSAIGLIGRGNAHPGQIEFRVARMEGDQAGWIFDALPDAATRP
jgi:hypothetical protein